MFKKKNSWRPTLIRLSLGFQSLIGYAEVKPKPTYFGIPTSCANLKGTGHTSSGLYSVMGSTMVETVFCDFNKLPNDSGFRTIKLITVDLFNINFNLQVSRSGSDTQM
jgi:hypothetical protein